MTTDIDYTEIRDERIRSKICELMSEMLDNPDKYEIYPTSKFMWEMETFILSETKMSMDNLIDQFVENLDFDVLIIWADILDVEHEENLWLDDMWPELESELRVKVSEAMAEIGRKR